MAKRGTKQNLPIYEYEVGSIKYPTYSAPGDVKRLTPTQREGLTPEEISTMEAMLNRRLLDGAVELARSWETVKAATDTVKFTSPIQSQAGTVRRELTLELLAEGADPEKGYEAANVPWSQLATWIKISELEIPQATTDRIAAGMKKDAEAYAKIQAGKAANEAKAAAKGEK